jgi:flavin reductase (DIM6/NTAB) family NADH-FMN oxidoreductase RutF
MSAGGAAQVPTARIDPEVFKAAFRNHPGGVAVISADSGDGPVAMTVTSVCSVSVDPPLLAFSVSDLSSSAPTILSASNVMVHLLDARDQELAVRCSTSGVDRFADQATWARSDAGDPYFLGVNIVLQCSIESHVRAGTANVILVQALSAVQSRGSEASTEVGPLVYHARTWHTLSDDSLLVL